MRRTRNTTAATATPAKQQTATSKSQNGNIQRTPMQTIYQWSSIITVIGACITAVSGLVAWFTKEAIDKEKDRAAHAQVANLQDQNRALEARLSEESNARARIEAGLQPRKLTSDQVAKIVGKLKFFAGTRADVVSVMSSAESQEFANSLAAAFTEAGWVADVSAAHFTPESPKGLEITVQNPGLAYATSLAEGLTDAGVSFRGVQDSSLPAETVRITVGIKTN